MNMVLERLRLYRHGYGDICSVEELLDISIKEIKRLNIIEEHRDILAIHMAEVKAIVEGTRQNTLKQVVDHCIEEIGNLPMKTSKVSQDQLDILRCAANKKNDSQSYINEYIPDIHGGDTNDLIDLLYMGLMIKKESEVSGVYTFHLSDQGCWMIGLPGVEQLEMG